MALENQNSTILSELSLVFEGKTCIKCNCQRTAADDNSPEWACPSCGVVYAKAEAAERERLADEALLNRVERVEFVKENQPVDVKEVAKIKSDKSIANLIYILYFGSIFGGVLGLAAIVLAHMHRKDMGKQNWVQSHYAWQISTFWFSLLWGCLGTVLVIASFLTASAKGVQNRSLNEAIGSFFNPFMLIGFAMIVIVSLWFWYRVIKGCIVLNRDEPVGNFYDASM
ncbi:MAG TPA: hypothetical protein PLG02_08890 [Methylotenera sp.]|nr:hypothetical protein [Methylotenera sp.]